MSKRVKLTAPNGFEIMIAADAVVELAVAQAGVDADGAKAVVFLSNGMRQAVRETVAEIDALLG